MYDMWLRHSYGHTWCIFLPTPAPSPAQRFSLVAPWVRGFWCAARCPPNDRRTFESSCSGTALRCGLLVAGSHCWPYSVWIDGWMDGMGWDGMDACIYQSSYLCIYASMYLLVCIYIHLLYVYVTVCEIRWIRSFMEWTIYVFPVIEGCGWERSGYSMKRCQWIWKKHMEWLKHIWNHGRLRFAVRVQLASC